MSKTIDPLVSEARKFDEKGTAGQRALGWGAIPYFQKRLAGGLRLGDEIALRMTGREAPVANTIACGDMAGEYKLLKRVGVVEIHASDISPGQRDRFYDNVYDGEIPVEYTIADANTIELEANRYDLVYFHHAYHHVERLEHVADQVRESLKPGGILAMTDYIGANFLQRTPRQRDLCSAIWRTMPDRYRVNALGQVLEELHIPKKATLSPYEAVRAEEIVAVLEERFIPVEKYVYAGILFPLFNGFAANYTDSAEDQEFLRLMWDLDRWLLETEQIEPTFMKAIYSPRT